MVVRVAERALQSGAQRVVIATDCPEIQSICAGHGHEALLTRADHPSGTDRIAEVAEQLNAGPDQTIVNVQGDEPLINPLLIASVAQALQSMPTASVSTAATPIRNDEDLRSPHVVKVVCDANSQAMYFSRSPIPYQRDQWPDLGSVHVSGPDAVLRHIGIYGFRARRLSEFVTWPQCTLERSEQLEQLRWLWNGHAIAVHITDAAPHPGVDTAADLERVRASWQASLL